jgi:hypothetical protein
MNMKDLDIEQLSSVAGGEPRGVNTQGRQNDGSDITSSNTRQGKVNTGDVIVGYSDGSTAVYFSGGGKPKIVW